MVLKLRTLFNGGSIAYRMFRLNLNGHRVRHRSQKHKVWSNCRNGYPIYTTGSKVTYEFKEISESLDGLAKRNAK